MAGETDQRLHHLDEAMACWTSISTFRNCARAYSNASQDCDEIADEWEFTCKQ